MAPSFPSTPAMTLHWSHLPAWCEKYFTVHCISYPMSITSSLHRCFCVLARSQWIQLTRMPWVWPRIYYCVHSHSRSSSTFDVLLGDPVCQIHDSRSWDELGSLGFKRAVLVLTSSFTIIRYFVKVLSSAPSATIAVQQREYTLHRYTMVWFSFAIAVRARVQMTWHGATRMTWEYWNDLSAIVSHSPFRALSAWFMCKVSSTSRKCRLNPISQYLSLLVVHVDGIDNCRLSGRMAASSRSYMMSHGLLSSLSLSSSILSKSANWLLWLRLVQTLQSWPKTVDC